VSMIVTLGHICRDNNTRGGCLRPTAGLPVPVNCDDKRSNRHRIGYSIWSAWPSRITSSLAFLWIAFVVLSGRVLRDLVHRPLSAADHPSVPATRWGSASGRRPRYQEPHFRLGLGRDGGSRKAAEVVRSSISSGEVAAASLAVSVGRFQVRSITRNPAPRLGRLAGQPSTVHQTGRRSIQVRSAHRSGPARRLTAHG